MSLKCACKKILFFFSDAIFFPGRERNVPAVPGRRLRHVRGLARRRGVLGAVQHRRQERQEARPRGEGEHRVWGAFLFLF